MVQKMKAKKNRIINKFRESHFRLGHLLMLFVILIFFQVFTSFVQKVSMRKFLFGSQQWYQRDFAERLANLTATSLEMLLSTSLQKEEMTGENAKNLIQGFNILLSQQLLQQHVQEVCILLADGNRIIPIDNGTVLFSYFFRKSRALPPPDEEHQASMAMYRQMQNEFVATEETRSILQGKQTFHVFVPLFPKGEYIGALYMKSTPDFGFVTSGIMASNNRTSMVFTALIFFGMLGMLYISSYTVKERDEAQRLLFQEREKQIEEKIHHEKEALFTKRIYHTNHKAEKVMGFIKDDLRAMAPDNFAETRYRVIKYANFISRVIYDMKWFDPPLQAIRNPLFKTDINEVIRFIVEHIFLRTSSQAEQFKIAMHLDENLPNVSINEFVIWEILEPLIQNCIDHGNEDDTIIQIKTTFIAERNESKIIISDNGPGIRTELLQEDEHGIKMIFLENISTKTDGKNSGYGCYIAHEIATQRCGWHLEAKNSLAGGAEFLLTVNH